MTVKFFQSLNGMDDKPFVSCRLQDNFPVLSLIHGLFFIIFSHTVISTNTSCLNHHYIILLF